MQPLTVRTERGMTRRELLLLASGAALSVVTGCGDQSSSTAGSSASSATGPQAVVDMFNAAGSDLSFLGAAASALGAEAEAIPFPVLKVAGMSLALLGGLCSAIGANVTLSQTLHESAPAPGIPHFEPGAGVDGKQRQLLEKYGSRHHWQVASGGGSSSDSEMLSGVQRRIAEACNTPCHTPLFAAESKKNGKTFYFQFLDSVHVFRTNTDELVINDSGIVYIMGHGNSAYRCRIRILEYLLEDDSCSWTVMADTQDDDPCPTCGCRVFVQEFTNDAAQGGQLYKKLYRFAPRNDPRFEEHRAHSGSDPGCRPEIPCGIRA